MFIPRSKFNITISYIVILILLSACGSSNDGDTGDRTNAPLALTFSSVTGHAKNTATNASINVGLTAPLDAGTVNSDSVSLTSGGEVVDAVATVTGSTITIDPSATLVGETGHTITVSSTVAGLSGSTLTGDVTVGFTTSATADTTPPEVVSTSPADADIDVGLNTAISATFNEPLDPATVTKTTFTLETAPPMPTAVTGTVTYHGLTATFTPDPDLGLDPATTYVATLTTDITDLAGNNLAENYTWRFTTGDAADTTPPTVLSTSPADGDTDVPLNTSVSAKFSEELDPATVTTANFTLSTGPGMMNAADVAGTVTLSGTTATFTADADLAANTTYTATLTTGITDLAGNALTHSVSWSFTTNGLADTTAPKVVPPTDPVDGAIDVALDTTVSATFNEPMDPVTINTHTFTLTAPGEGMGGEGMVVSVTGIVDYDDTSNTANFTPTAALDPDTIYTATITTGVTDLAGNALAADFPWSFTTVNNVLAVTATTPPDGATDMPLNTLIVVYFSEPVDPDPLTTTVTTDTFTLTTGAGMNLTDIAGEVEVASDGLSARFIPTNVDGDPINLDADTIYTATVTVGVIAVDLTPLAADVSWTFETGTVVDNVSPSREAYAPGAGVQDVFVNVGLGIEFDEPIDPATANTNSFQLMDDDAGKLVAGAVFVSPDGLSVIFAADAEVDDLSILDLAADTNYTITVLTAISDFAGNAIDQEYSWSFKTGFDSDELAPTVESTDPTGATPVPVPADVRAIFSEGMNPLTISNATFTLSSDGGGGHGGPGMGGPVSGTVQYLGLFQTAVFTPDAALTANTTYTATITTDVTDFALLPLATDYTWTFTTE